MTAISSHEAWLRGLRQCIPEGGEWRWRADAEPEAPTVGAS